MWFYIGVGFIILATLVIFGAGVFAVALGEEVPLSGEHLGADSSQDDLADCLRFIDQAVRSSDPVPDDVASISSGVYAALAEWMSSRYEEENQ